MQPKEWDRIAPRYFDVLDSPFAEGVTNPVYKFLRQIKGKRQMTAIDLGCGIGNFLPYLARRFKRVIAVDFSPKMLELAKGNCSRFKNIEFVEQDISNMKQFHDAADVAVAVNSIIMPSLEANNKAFQEAFNVLKSPGYFLGVFPSINSDLYRAMLTFEREFEETGNEKQAIRNTHLIIGSRDYDFLTGHYENEGKQKHFYKFEVEYKLKRLGFKNVKYEKVLYPWSMAPERFEGQPKLWDMFFYGEKP
ncbi:MAG: class I SAM-dependent methyltransferase [Candidatus Woesearchaeota archaeon]